MYLINSDDKEQARMTLKILDIFFIFFPCHNLGSIRQACDGVTNLGTYLYNISFRQTYSYNVVRYLRIGVRSKYISTISYSTLNHHDLRFTFCHSVA